MWDNHRLLNGIASGLYAVAGAAAALWRAVAIVRLPIFPLREVEVERPHRAHHSRPGAGDRGRAAQGQLLHAGSGASARGVREAALGAQGQRAPAVARPAGGRDRGARGGRALARQRAGEQLRRGVRGGDQRSAAGVRRSGRARPPRWRSATSAFRQVLAPLGKRPASRCCRSAAPGSCELDDGDVLELGREQMDERLQRFVTAYRPHAGATAGRAYRIDLRYPNGFAVRTPQLPVHASGA